MSDTSEAEDEAPRVRILCAPPSTTSLHQPTPPFATLLIHAHNHPSPPRPARNPAAHQTGRHDQGAGQRGHTRVWTRGSLGVLDDTAADTVAATSAPRKVRGGEGRERPYSPESLAPYSPDGQAKRGQVARHRLRRYDLPAKNRRRAPKLPIN